MYDAQRAIEYAARWAHGRNPRWGDFTLLGGDCTNFASQCLYAGGCPMAYAPEGWFYRSMRDRAPAWSGCRELRRYLLQSGRGQPAEVALPGDLIFLSDGRRVYHVVVAIRGGADPLVAAHTRDAYLAPLSGCGARAAYVIRPLR